MTRKADELICQHDKLPPQPRLRIDAALAASFFQKLVFRTKIDVLGQRIDRLPVANPVPGKPVSSHYGSRMDPFVGRKAMHLGTDFRARSGSRVHAAASGTIKFAGRRGGYGNLVEIDHGNGLITRFAHLSRILVAKGDKVVRGAVVGKVGSTGRSTGPHLHYEVRRNGRALNPARFLKAGRELENLMKKSG